MSSESVNTRLARKSERLTAAELSSLKKYKKGFDFNVDCANAIGIDRNVLDRVLLAGSGSPLTISKIRAAIGTEAAKIA